jgi:hypothetical protein
VLDWDGGDFRTLCKIDQELEDAAGRGGRGAGKMCGGAETEMRESMLVTLVLNLLTWFLMNETRGVTFLSKKVLVSPCPKGRGSFTGQEAAGQL